MPPTDLSRGTLKRASETGQPAKRLQPHARLWETGTKLNPMLQSPAMLAPTAADLADSEATVPLTDLSRGTLKRAMPSEIRCAAALTMPRHRIGCCRALPSEIRCAAALTMPRHHSLLFCALGSCEWWHDHRPRPSLICPTATSESAAAEGPQFPSSPASLRRLAFC